MREDIRIVGEMSLKSAYVSTCHLLRHNLSKVVELVGEGALSFSLSSGDNVIN